MSVVGTSQSISWPTLTMIVGHLTCMYPTYIHINPSLIPHPLYEAIIHIHVYTTTHAYTHIQILQHIDSFDGGKPHKSALWQILDFYHNSTIGDFNTPTSRVFNDDPTKITNHSHYAPVLKVETEKKLNAHPSLFKKRMHTQSPKCTGIVSYFRLVQPRKGSS